MCLLIYIHVCKHLHIYILKHVFTTCIHIHEHTHLCSYTHIRAQSGNRHISSEQGKFHQAYNYHRIWSWTKSRPAAGPQCPSYQENWSQAPFTIPPPLTKQEDTDNRHVYIFTYDDNSSIKWLCLLYYVYRFTNGLQILAAKIVHQIL